MEKIVFWHWWVIGVVLIILEAFIPGTILMWMGVSAGVVGLVLLIAPGMGWEYQVLLFAVFSVASISLWMMKLKKQPPAEPEVPNLNRRVAQYIGRSARLETAIVDGLGTINVDDIIWRVLGPDSPVGTKVKVVSAKGTDLVVEVVDPE
jgi:membrane protein implicated in regulation of membrane protease activity